MSILMATGPNKKVIIHSTCFGNLLHVAGHLQSLREQTSMNLNLKVSTLKPCLHLGSNHLQSTYIQLDLSECECPPIQFNPD